MFNQLGERKPDALIWELKVRDISVLESALCVSLYMFTYFCGDEKLEAYYTCVDQQPL